MAISLLVHEKISVVENQIQNLTKYIPNALIVIHNSRSSSIENSILQQKTKKFPNVALNPNQTETSWGSIYQGHISNLKFIKHIANIENVAFHSSNDMLVRSGLEKYIGASSSLFHLREANFHSEWWPARTAFQDERLSRILSTIGTSKIFGSQIEGSVYPMAALIELLKLENRFKSTKEGLFYPREEIYFPSILHAMGLQPTGNPYIYSEVHKFDDEIWKLKKALKKCHISRLYGPLHDKFFKLETYALSKRDVRFVQNGKIPRRFSNRVFDGIMEWSPYDQGSLYGVKRVKRDLDDKIRMYIEKA